MTIVGPGANISQAATAEINATGRVVYGYNLRVTAAGVYTITFTFPNVTISGADAGTVVGVDRCHWTSLSQAAVAVAVAEAEAASSQYQR